MGAETRGWRPAPEIGELPGPAGSVVGRPIGPTPREKVLEMASVCEVCGKHPSFGMSVSHSHRRTKRRWNPNIQRVRALVNGSPKRVNVCTSCLKAGKVQKLAH